MSMKATVCSSWSRISAGASPAAIAQKMQSSPTARDRSGAAARLPLPAKAISRLLGELLGPDVDRPFPVDPLEVCRIGTVKRLEVRPTDETEIERIAVGVGGSTVRGQVEALETQLRVEVQRRRDAVSEFLHQVVVKLARRRHSSYESPQLRRRYRREAGEPLDASCGAEVALTRTPLGAHVFLKATRRRLGEQPLERSRDGIDAALKVRVK